jgi:hypothetical protein
MQAFPGIPRVAAIRRALALILSSAAVAASAQQPAEGWQAGAVLDLSASSRELALGQRDQGLGLGHSDVSVRGPLGPHFEAQGTVAAHTLERKLEFDLEEAWVQTRSLPAGLQLRAGRFSSQMGYLNEQHPHADDFIQRPLLYRAFLGGHWFDDGLRINWTAPTDLYLRLGLEVFRGRQLVEEAESSRRPGALVLSARTGGDIGRSQSWQAGLALLHNRREAALEPEGEEGHAAEGGEAHAHGASFSGRRMWLGDVAWKWAPEGNNRQQQLRIVYEHAVVMRPNRFATRSDRHHAGYLSAVYRFAPAWEAGVRADVLRVREVHEDHADDSRLREAAVMLAYKPSHAQTVRVQFTRQQDRGGFPAANRSVQLQYIRNFGAHASHSF